MAYSQQQRADATAAVKTTLWARLAVRHTKKTCAVAALVPLVAVALIIGTKTFSIDTPSGVDYVVRDDLRTRLDDARKAARDEFAYVEEPGAKEEERTEADRAYALVMLFRGKVEGKVGVLGDTSDHAENLLTRENIALMKKAENDMMNDDQFKRFCLKGKTGCDEEDLHCKLPQSLLMSRHLYGRYQSGKLCGRGEEADVVSEEQWGLFLAELQGNEERVVNPAYSPFMGSDFSKENGTWITQIVFDIGLPFTGYEGVDDRMEEQTAEYHEWAVKVADRARQFSTGKVDVFMTGTQLIDASFGSVVMRDLSFSIAAMVLVFLVIWLHTTSAFLAVTAMAQIFLAFPLAFVFYHFVFRQLYFAALQILVIFLLLGIGADDVFVFTDAWKQAAVVLDVDDSENGLITRMSWTYRRAMRAMSVTSITTAAAFFVTATSPIMPISTLGVWAGLLILLQYGLVITMYPCAVITWYRFWRLRPILRCFKMVPNDKQGQLADTELRAPLWHKLVPIKWRPTPKTAGVSEYRALEKFFRGPWFKLVHRGRFIIVVVGVILAGVFIFLATQLEPPQETEQFLPEDNELLVANTAVRDAFPRSEADYQLQVHVTWGINSIDRSGTSRFTPNQPGKAVLDDKFDLTSAAAQQHVLDTCEFFEKKKDLIFQGATIDAVSCWARDFKRWRRSLNGDGFKDYRSQKELAQELLDFVGFKNEPDGQMPYVKYRESQQIAFSLNRDRVVFTEVVFVTPMEAQVPYRIMWPVYNEWQDQLEILNRQTRADIRENIGNAVATGGYAWMWQITQRTLVTSMFTGIGVVFAVALVALTVSTLSWAIAILATLAIAAIVAMLLGLIYLYGWQLGITESIGVVIAVGYSFDGVAHMATAYVESRSVDRASRTKDALTDLGISIFFGVISTLLAGVMLLPAVITFFVKFAGLIISTIGLGLVWALFFFPALLLVVGPVGEFGSLKPLLSKLPSCVRRKKQATQHEDGTIAAVCNRTDTGVEVGRAEDV